MRKVKRNNLAVNEVLDTILLIGIAVALFSVLSFIVLTYPFEPSTPSVNIVGFVDGNDIVLEHRGGESLDLDTEVLITVGGEKLAQNKVRDFLDDNFEDDGLWGLGEILNYTSDAIDGNQVTVTIVDTKSNSVVMMGTLQEGSSETPPINRTPSFESSSPSNGSTNQPLSFTWQIVITDSDSDLIDWEIECNNSQTNSSNGESGGIKSLTLSGLSESTTYTVWVNATDPSGSGQWAREVFTFTTGATVVLIETFVDSISGPVTSLPYTITATGDSSLDNVELFYKWESTQENSICDGFEIGTMNGSLWNTYQDGDDARIQFNYGTAHSGSYSCAMDDYDTNTGDYSLNELYTVYDFTGASDVNIDFWERDNGDEDHNPPSSWYGHGNYDAVAFTNDGNTWYTIFDAGELGNSGWEHFTYNISIHPNFNLNVNSSFAIKFQQYDNYQLNYNGRLWDDICINFTSDDITSWNSWSDADNPDTNGADGWSWEFNFPEGEGYYEFYSIGKKSGLTDELLPSSADASCQYTIPWTTLTYDDFESGWDNYESGGEDCYLYTGSTYAHQGSNAVGMQDNSGSASSFWHTTGIDVNTPGYTSIKVDFWFITESMDNSNEDFWVQYYDGSTWHTVADYDYEDDFVNGQFYHEIFYINEASYIFPTDMRIRFRCDASGHNDDVYIDEIEISAK